MRAIRPLAAGLTCLTLVCTGFVYSPAQTSAGSATDNSTPVIDAKAMALLKQNQELMYHLRTFQAVCSTTTKNSDSSSTSNDNVVELAVLKAQKPNRMRYEMWRLTGVPGSGTFARPSGKTDTMYSCDGNSLYRQMGDSVRQDDNVSPNFLVTGPEPWRGFYMPGVSAYSTTLTAKQNGELRDVRIAGSDIVDGVPCTEVLVHTSRKFNGGAIKESSTLYLSSDHLIRRCVDSVSYGDEPGSTRDAVLSKIVLNAAIDQVEFASAPGGKVLAITAHSTVHHYGKPAPDFTVLTSNRKFVKLSDFKGKVVILDFFASWCGPCMAAMPHNQEVMKKFDAIGLPVVMLAVDDGEDRLQFDAWIALRGAQYPDLTFGHAAERSVSAALYRVSSIPNQFVVDQDGVICAHFVGYGGPSDELEMAVKAALGVKK